jgi:hypothetical protein
MKTYQQILKEAKLPSQYTNKIPGIPAKAFDWFMQYQQQFSTKEMNFKKLNVDKVSVNSSFLSAKQRGQIADKLGMNHKKMVRELEKLIPALRDKWSEIQNAAHNEVYGEDPDFGSYKVSGIGDNKYSDTHKKQLRTLAHMETAFKNALEGHKAIK